jgi:ATP-binding cassette, subfamily B, bacterial
MFRKFKESPFYQAVLFSVPRVFRVGKGLLALIVIAQVISALLAPTAALLLGKIAVTVKTMMESSSTDMSPLLPWILLAAAISVITAICRISIRYCSCCLSDRMVLAMQHEVVSHIASLNLEMIEDRTTLDIIVRGQQSPGINILKFTTGFIGVTSSLLRIGGLLGVLFWISPLWSTLIVLLSIPALIGNRILSRINFKIKRSKTTAQRWSSYYTSTLTNRGMIPSVATLGITPLFLKRFDDTMRDINAVKRGFYRLRSIVTLAAALLMVGTLITALWTVAMDTSAGLIDIGRFTAFWVAAWRIQAALTKLGATFFTISELEFNILNLRELFALRNTMPESGDTPPEKDLGDIHIRDLTFIYQGTNRPVLKDLSLSIRQGETIAIVGPNGSGKTTLAKLIAQLYMPTDGNIQMGNQPAMELDRDQLHKRISFITQNPVQFEATAFENIAFGDWERLKANPTQVHRLAEQVQIDRMIKNMPEGYDTLLGRKFGTYDISGGQRQKLALARALACDPSLIILDEPTASLDIHTEYQLYSNIKEMTRNTTTILISHRFSTVRMADRIFVLNEGHITESGTHAELIEHNGTYTAMFKMYEDMSGIL